MMSIPIPRFSGRAIKVGKKWKWEFIVSMLGEEEGQLFGSTKSFNTKEEAIVSLRAAIQDGIKHLAAQIPDMGISTDNYIDMKTNSTRRWDGGNEH